MADLGLHRGYYAADTSAFKAGLDYLWPMGDVTLKLLTLEEGLLDTHSDIFIRNLHIFVVPCLIILMATLAILFYMLFRTQDSTMINFEQAVLGYFFIVGQQHDGYLLTACDKYVHGRVIFFIAILSSMLCLNIYESQMAAQIATSQIKELTLNNLNNDGQDHR